MSAKKTEFEKRMETLLGESEAPRFFDSIDEIRESGKKSLRIHPASNLSVDRMTQAGFKILDQVPWCANGWFFDRDQSPDLATHPFALSGAIFVQEAGAMEPVELLAPKPGEIVLDLCAAPGAKSTQIIEKLGGQGWLVANDPVQDRAKTLDQLLCRHGAVNSTVYNLEPHRMEEEFAGRFDAILVDAPCSGESLFAKRKEQRGDVKDAEIERCASRQSSILKSAARMLKPRGRVLYSTCAYAKEENEEVIAAFLSAHPDFTLSHESRRYPHRDGVPGGYAALLVRENSGSKEITHPETLPVLDRLIRNGQSRWDGSTDDYLSFMVRGGKSPFPVLDVSQAELKSILSNSFTSQLSEKIRALSPEKNSLVGLRSEGEKIGLVRVETNRILSLIPR